MRYCILILLVISVVCDNICVTYDFEDGFEDFSYDYRVCVGLAEWTAGDYSSLDIESPHAKSTTFISPATTMSCVASFQFEMNALGSVEVNFYMDPASTGDQLSILAFQSIDNLNDPTVGSTVTTASSPTFVSGWQTARFPVSGSASFSGYLTFMGLASADSILIIDSFRFLPPNSDEELCLIYEDDITTTEATTTETTTQTTDITTTEVTTTETTIQTTDITTTEATTAETITPTTDITITEAITTEATTTETTTPTMTEVTITETITTETITTETTTTEITTATEFTTIPPTLDHSESESLETDSESAVTESPIIDKDSFWNAFTISMVVVLALTALALVFCIFYYIGRTRSSKEDQDAIIDERDLPKFKVPRVNKTNSSKFYGKFSV